MWRGRSGTGGCRVKTLLAQSRGGGCSGEDPTSRQARAESVRVKTLLGSWHGLAWEVEIVGCGQVASRLLSHARCSAPAA